MLDLELATLSLIGLIYQTELHSLVFWGFKEENAWFLYNSGNKFKFLKF